MRRGWAIPGLLALATCAHGPSVPPEQVHRALDLQAVGPVAYDPRVLDGKVVLVDFFATYCFPCLTDLPNLEELQKRYAAKGLVIVAVGMDLEGPLALEPFAQNYNLSFPILVADDAIRQGNSPFGPVSVLPTTVLLSRQREVIAAYGGVADGPTVRRLVERALSY